MVHPFIVEERIVDGNVARIVRGIKQNRWVAISVIGAQKQL